MPKRALVLAALVVGCGAPPTVTSRAVPPPERTVAAYDRAEGFAGAVRLRFSAQDDRMFALPWPTELWRRANGRVSFEAFVGRDSFAGGPIIENTTDGLLGFSIAPVIYFPSEGGLEDDVVRRAIEAGRIRLLDVDPSSDERGREHPLKHRVYRGASHVPDGTLALRPRAVLRPDHLYLALVMRDLAEGAEPLGTTADFERTKSTVSQPDPRVERARVLHADTLAWLAGQGVSRADIASMALFRTQPAREPVQQVLSAVMRDEEARPHILSASWVQDWDRFGYHAIRGYYCTPNFQGGIEQAPFVDGGGVIRRGDGAARVIPIPPASDKYDAACDGKMRARFVLTFPTGAMPDTGWPLLVYAHGTTGDATSVLGGGHFAARAARAGMAAVSTDQPLHGSDDPRGARPGSDSTFAFKLGPVPIPLPGKGKGGELAFYNVLRPLVLRDNLRQATADGAVLARLVLATDFRVASSPRGDPLLAQRSDTKRPRFNQALGYVAAGHSQGSQSMAALGALDPLAQGSLLSACGGDFSSAMLLRPDAQKVRRIVELVLGLSGGELDEFHPFATFIQTALDPVDPQTFGAAYRDPNGKPRSALLVSGVGDRMTVDEAGAVLARAMGLTPLAPMAKPIDGLQPLSAVTASPGGATRALLQLAPSYAYEPHFVAFQEPVAARVMEQYLRALALGDRAPKLQRR